LRRKCFLRYVIEGKIDGRIEVAGRQRKRRKQLLNDRKVKGGHCELNEEALDRFLRITHFGFDYGTEDKLPGSGYGSVVRQTAE
jgi:hypothetical protein